MSTDDFYEEQTEQSEIKTEIVRKYFWAWAKVISKQVQKRGNSEIGYVDLFAGPGSYEDGSKSTPVLILEGAIRDVEISNMLVASFNDENPRNCEKLKGEIALMPDIVGLAHTPIVTNHPVDDDLAVKFEADTTIPTLYFLDPWGYKGLSLRLVKAVIGSWGCDCMFFFNYNRINAALSNDVMTSNMNAFFGAERANKLRQAIADKSPAEREALIVGGLKDSITALGGEYCIEYFFKDINGTKTSHFLIFVSKNVLGYSIMKNIMAKESSQSTEGVASFGFNPKDRENKEMAERAPFLFDMFDSPIETLAEELLLHFRGQTLTANEVFQRHNIGKSFIFKNYQDALRQLESHSKILVKPPAGERRRINGILTFSENVLVEFPASEFAYGNEIND